MAEFYQKHKAAFNKAFILLGFLVFLIIVGLAFSLIAPFFVAFIISLILNPIVGLLQRRLKIARGISGAFLIIICILLIIWLAATIFGRLSAEAAGFIADIPAYIEGVQELLNSLVGQMEATTGLSPVDMGLAFGNLAEDILNFVISFLQDGIERGTIGLFTAIPWAILRVMLTIISAFFFIKDKDKIYAAVGRLLPDRFVNKMRSIRRGVLKALAAYAKGQLIIMSIVSVICITGLLIIRSPYAFLLGVGIAVFDLIPVVGAGWILVPWSVYNLLVGNFTFAIGLLVIYGIIFLARQLIEPRIVAGKIGVHPLVLLMSVYIGIQIIGPFGILIGPFVAVIVKTVYSE